MTETTTTTKPRASRAKPPTTGPSGPAGDSGAATEAEEPKGLTPNEMNIYERINAIATEAGALAPESKGGVPFAFRGIDGVVAHLSPFMRKYGVMIFPVKSEGETTEKAAGNKTVKTTDIIQTFRVVATNGEDFEFQTRGLADDYADRSAAQAQSVALRVALLQLFFLPTHSRDPEETGQDVANDNGKVTRQQATIAAAVQGKAQTTPPAAPTQAVAPAPGSPAWVMDQIKMNSQKVGHSFAQVNTKGAELSGGKTPDEWMKDQSTMEALHKHYKDLADAAS